MSDHHKKYEGKGAVHRAAQSSSPYPVSRLAPAIELVDLAKEIEQADTMVNVRVSSKLQVVADQIRALQQEARCILAEAKQDEDLHHVSCSFKKKPGQTYHLYQKEDQDRYFSMLSPDDWKGSPPHSFLGSYYLEADMSWRIAGEKADDNTTNRLVEKLLETA